MSNKCLWLSTMTFQTIVNCTFTGMCTLLVIPCDPGYAFRAMVCCTTPLLSSRVGRSVVAQIMAAVAVT